VPEQKAIPLMFKNFRIHWVWCLLLFLIGTLGSGPHAQSQSKESTPPELVVTRLDGKVETPRWSRFSFGEPALFTAIFPQQPQQATNGDSRKDQRFGSWMFFAADETALYQIVWTVDGTSSMPKSETQKLQDYINFAAGFFDGLVKGGHVTGGRISGERRIRSSGIEGFERDTVFKDHESKLQMFHFGNAALTVISLWNSDNALSDRKAFFEAVKFGTGVPVNVPIVKSPIADWKRYQIGNRASIMLPAKPAEEKTPIGNSSNPGSYYRLNDPDYYSIAVVPVSVAYAPMSAPERERLFQDLWGSLTERIRSEVSRAKSPAKLQMTTLPEVRAAGAVVQEREFDIGRLNGRARIILNDKTVYVVMAFWSLETPLTVRDAFFESFTTDATAR